MRKSPCCSAKTGLYAIGKWEKDTGPGARRGDMRQPREVRCGKCGQVVKPHDPSDETMFAYHLSGMPF